MKTMTLFPCNSKGMILKGFCPTICESDKDFAETILGYISFSKMFGIRYYSLNGVIKKLL